MSEQDSPTPCFYFALCEDYAVTCKQGRGVCRKCADRMSGQEYPFTFENNRHGWIQPDAWGGQFMTRLNLRGG